MAEKYVTVEHLLKDGYGVDPKSSRMPLAITDDTSELFDMDEAKIEEELTNEENNNQNELTEKKKNKIINYVDNCAKNHRYVTEGIEEYSIIPLFEIVNKLETYEEFLFALEYAKSQHYQIRGNDLSAVDEIDDYSRSALNIIKKLPPIYSKVRQKRHLNRLAQLCKMIYAAYSLNQEDEVEIEKKTHFEKILKCLENEDGYSEIVTEYRDIRNQLVEHNLRFTEWYIYKKHLRKDEDRMQYAYMITMDAVNNCAINTGLKGKHYALTTYIGSMLNWRYQRDYFKHEMKKGFTGISYQDFERIKKIRMLRKKYEEQMSEENVNYMISEKMWMTPDKLQSYEPIEDILYGTLDSYDAIIEKREEIPNQESFDHIDPLKPRIKGTYFNETFANNDTGDYIPTVTNFKALQDVLRDVLEELGDSERKVISLHFGLEDGHPRTYKEIGREFGLTPEWIRQKVNKAFHKLFYSPKGYYNKAYYILKQYLNNENMEIDFTDALKHYNETHENKSNKR